LPSAHAHKTLAPGIHLLGPDEWDEQAARSKKPERQQEESSFMIFIFDDFAPLERVEKLGIVACDRL
jgi:hypothetical protein